MPDFLVKYGTQGASLASAEADLAVVAANIGGLWVAAYTDENGVLVPGYPGVGGPVIIPQDGDWALSQPWQWYATPGDTTSDGWWYRTFRWNAALGLLGPFIAAGGGALSVDPITGAITITGLLVTLTSPLPPDCPVRF